MIPSTPHPFVVAPVPLRLIGGDGADLFVDAAASANFVPGSGPDQVQTGTGFDYIEASAGAPDEADIYEFGTGFDGTVRYSSATYPVSVSLDGVANDGADGEADQVIGTPNVVGGSGDDVLIGRDDPSVPNDLEDGRRRSHPRWSWKRLAGRWQRERQRDRRRRR